MNIQVINSNWLHFSDVLPHIDKWDNSMTSDVIEKYKLTDIHLQYVTRLSIGLDFEFYRQCGKSHFVLRSLIRIRSRFFFILIMTILRI